MAESNSSKTSVVIMWIFTILLLVGIVITLVPLIKNLVASKLKNKNDILALSGVIMMVVGFLGSMITGIVSSNKSKKESSTETFMRLYGLF